MAVSALYNVSQIEGERQREKEREGSKGLTKSGSEAVMKDTGLTLLQSVFCIRMSLTEKLALFNNTSSSCAHPLCT